jgi:hypothetical protein
LLASFIAQKTEKKKKEKKTYSRHIQRSQKVSAWL